jgi:hypothetical protein
MAVFNYFARKEDMFFDRDEEAREMLREALRQRDPRVPFSRLFIREASAYQLRWQAPPTSKGNAGRRGVGRSQQPARWLRHLNKPQIWLKTPCPKFTGLTHHFFQ